MAIFNIRECPSPHLDGRRSQTGSDFTPFRGAIDDDTDRVANPAPSCQVCGATARRPFIRHEGMELFECAACGLIYLDPMPAPDESERLYDDACAGASEGYFRKVPEKMRRARRRLAQIARIVKPAPNGRFLDVGCNGGFMVEAARAHGFEAHGIDLDPVSIAWARAHYPGGRFVHGRIEDYADPGPFDAVYCSEVIEHVADANAFLAAIAERMRPGALLYLTTPDIGHWRRPRDVRRWDGFCPPAHCLYFNPRNLTQLLARHGFEVFRRRLALKPGIKLLAWRR